MGLRIEKLSKSDKGAWVSYKSHGSPDEKGRIKSFNDRWVFVVYNCDDDWDNYNNYTAAATDPRDLTFTTPIEQETE